MTVVSLIGLIVVSINSIPADSPAPIDKSLEAISSSSINNLTLPLKSRLPLLTVIFKVFSTPAYTAVSYLYSGAIVADMEYFSGVFIFNN